MTTDREPATGLQAALGDTWFPARTIASGAAYELYSDAPLPGFFRTGSGTRWPYHRFAHVSEVAAVAGDAGAHPGDQPLRVPLYQALTWQYVHQQSQAPPRDSRASELLATVRATATVQCGTRMVKPLTARQVAAHLRGRLPAGFCYREYDVAHLRTPTDLAILGSASEPADDDIAGFTLSWRATDPSDYHCPTGDYHGLTAIPPPERVGPMVLGTGFAPSGRHLIPEFVTADLADLPLPSGAQLLAYTREGTMVPLYTFQPEQRGWIRLAGPQWHSLLAAIPDLPAQAEYLAVPPGPDGWSGTTRLVGSFRGDEHEVIAEPPREFRVLSRHRAARFPVEVLTRRTRFCHWRGVRCTVVRAEQRWVRVRLVRPDFETITALGAQCQERGVYETWAPTDELTNRVDSDHHYPPANTAASPGHMSARQ